MLMDSGWVRRMTTRIVGTGSYVPEQIVTNDDLAKIVETNDEWIRSRTGDRGEKDCHQRKHLLCGG